MKQKRRHLPQREDLGFSRVRQKGSHVFFRHPDGRTATVPCHASAVYHARSLSQEGPGHTGKGPSFIRSQVHVPKGLTTATVPAAVPRGSSGKKRKASQRGWIALCEAFSAVTHPPREPSPWQPRSQVLQVPGTGAPTRRLLLG
ncbi:MAG TPA: addiction module toxin, HicA family [Firmicutes bacterium]|nr:addiction module toxin, HicA family [Bacillota bacterium]